ncbi:MAG TPA: methyl-accepting chemotaxis protein [Candidatus Saccharimonadales bacterium]|nr:methyl-accepting chemotaxis protein [Candidatus Saccharimonadales bacterium]
MKLWNNLQGRLILYFVLLATVPLTVTSIIAYRRASESLIRVEHAHLQVLLDSKMEESERMIRVFSGQDVDPATVTAVLKPFVERIHVGNNGFAILLRSDGTVLSSTAGRPLPSRLELPANDAGRSEVAHFEWGRDRYYAVFRPYAGRDLVMAVASSESDFMRSVEDLKTMTVVTGILTLILAIALALVLSRGISRPVTGVVTTAQGIARGDLRLYVHSTGGTRELRELAGALGEMNRQLRNMILRVRDSATGVSRLSGKIEEDSRQAAMAAREQTSQVERVVVAVSQARAASTQTRNSSMRTAELARASAEAAQRGHDAVTDTIRGIERIEQVVTGGAEIIRKLGQGSAEIGEVIMVIDEIADQTNLLALNAAIEAARADEHGRGFAVVADEVRKLAERTSMATREIARTIKSIQDDARRAVESMEHGTAEVTQGRELADRAGLSLREILAVSHQMLTGMEGNNKAATDQAQAAEEIAEKMQRISAAIAETDQRVAWVAAAAEQLNSETETLNELVAQFRLEPQGAAAPVEAESRVAPESHARAA